MPSMSDMIRSGVQTLASGGTLDSNTIGNLGNKSGTQAVEQTSPLSSATDQDDSVYRASDSSTENTLLPGEDDPTDSSDQPSENQQAKAKPGDPEQKTSETKEIITVTDEKGRRRKVEIDYSDRKQVKQAFEMMHGARKWQAERDQALKSSKEVENTKKDLESRWNSLEDAFSKGPEHLFDVLTGQKGAFQSHIQKEIAKQEFLKQASPEEVDAYNTKQELDRIRKERDLDLKKNEEFRKKIESERETSELRSMESRVHPVFEKYRFAEKLGDANDEHMFDEMLWNSALKRLEPYEEQGLDITPELVEREFRSVASAIRKRIGLQAEKKASRVIDQKKQEATENVQSSLKSGYKQNNLRQEANDMLQTGSVRGLLKNFNRYKGLFK